MCKGSIFVFMEAKVQKASIHVSTCISDTVFFLGRDFFIPAISVYCSSSHVRLLGSTVAKSINSPLLLLA